MELINSILIAMIQFIEVVITKMGACGIALLMAIESCNIPLPSEAILTFAGYLVTKNVMTIHTASWAGAIGCVLGSIPSYYLGYFGGRPFIQKYGKWFLISHKDLEIADKWAEKYGDWSFFICRMLPVVRTFISLPAGILRANFPKFIFFTFLGSLVWSYFLVYIGIKFGENIDKFKELWHSFDVIIILLCVVFGVWYIYRHFKHLKDS